MRYVFALFSCHYGQVWWWAGVVSVMSICLVGVLKNVPVPLRSEAKNKKKVDFCHCCYWQSKSECPRSTSLWSVTCSWLPGQPLTPSPCSLDTDTSEQDASLLDKEYAGWKNLLQATDWRRITEMNHWLIAQLLSKNVKSHECTTVFGGHNCKTRGL